MVFDKIVLNSVIFSVIGAGYIFIFMITFNPRIWGYQDYPDRIKEKVPSQTRKERTIAGLVGLPWFVFIIFYPLFSTAALKSELGGEIPFEIAFANILFMMIAFFLVDLVILDWLIISKITPKFVIIDGTTVEDYKDFSHHYRGHLIMFIPLVLFCIILSVIVVMV